MVQHREMDGAIVIRHPVRDNQRISVVVRLMGPAVVNLREHSIGSVWIQHVLHELIIMILNSIIMVCIVIIITSMGV